MLASDRGRGSAEIAEEVGEPTDEGIVEVAFAVGGSSAAGCCAIGSGCSLARVRM